MIILVFLSVAFAVELRATTHTQGLLGETCLRQLAKHKCVANDAPCKGVKIPGFCNTGVCCFEGSSADCDKAGGKCTATKECESTVFAAHTPHCPGSNEVKCCVNTKKECESFTETKTYCSSKGHCEAVKKVFVKDPSFKCGKAEGCCVGAPKEDEGCKAKGGACKLATDCQDKGEIHDGRGLCPGKKVKCCVPKLTPAAQAAVKKEQADKTAKMESKAQVSALKAEMAANPAKAPDKSVTDPKTNSPKQGPPKQDMPKPKGGDESGGGGGGGEKQEGAAASSDNQATPASLLEISTGHELRADPANAGEGGPHLFPNTQGYTDPGQGVPEVRPNDEPGVVTIPEAVLKAENLEKQSQSFAVSNSVEECVGCQFILGQLVLLVGNTQNEGLISSTLTRLCFESLGTLIESACRWIHSLLDDITTDYLDGSDPGSICERNSLCRGGPSPLKPRD